MKNRMLLPNSFRIAGMVLVLLSLALFVAWDQYNFRFDFLNIAPPPGSDSFSAIMEDNNLTNECIILGLLTGLLCIAFAKDKHEDERITMIRLQTLQVSHYLSYIVFAVSLFLINGISFLLALLYLPYLFLIIFILLFYCRLYLLPKFANNEK